MKKMILTVMALALLAPLTLMAQDTSPDRTFCPQGKGYGNAMKQGHHGLRGGDCGPTDGRGGKGRRGGGIGRLLMMGDKIDLTDAQRDQLKTMQTEFQLEQIDRKAEMQKANLKLRTLKRDPDAAEGDVMRAIDATSGLKADMQKIQYKHRKQIQAVLTDEQIGKLKELRKTHGQGMGMGKKGHGQMGRRGGNGRP